MYPDKMLSRHFWTPSMRDRLQANLNIFKKRMFSELQAKLGADVETNLGLHNVVKQVQDTLYHIYKMEGKNCVTS